MRFRTQRLADITGLMKVGLADNQASLTLLREIYEQEELIMATIQEIKMKVDTLDVAVATLIADADDIKARLDAAIASNDPVVMQTVSDKLGVVIANVQAEHAKLTG